MPGDPWEQLRGAVEAVFRSWNSDRARAYRERRGSATSLGTGVTVQAMVFGNLGSDSGTGVLFTRNPATGEAALYGDVMFGAQGEDVVAGTHETEPVSCLETRMPAVAAELRAVRRASWSATTGTAATSSSRSSAAACGCSRCGSASGRPRPPSGWPSRWPRTRSSRSSREDAVRRVGAHCSPTRPASSWTGPTPARRSPVGSGASPGLASGEIRLTPEDAVAAADAGRDVILVRAETSPDDVHGMQRSCGILTSTGGFASHAAVVARGWGIPAVVGARRRPHRGRGRRHRRARAARRGGHHDRRLRAGEVFEGVASGVEVVVPEAKVLLGWARELGIDVQPGNGGTDTVGVAARPAPDRHRRSRRR